MYMLVDLATGTLPWLKHSRASTAILKEKLMDMEYMHVSVAIFLFFNPTTIVQGCPVTFSAILNYLRGLNYFQRPDYVGLERLFILMMQARNVSQSQPMSWETNVSLLRKASFLLNFPLNFRSSDMIIRDELGTQRRRWNKARRAVTHRHREH